MDNKSVGFLMVELLRFFVCSCIENVNEVVHQNLQDFVAEFIHAFS